jgi:phosphoglycerol transferase
MTESRRSWLAYLGAMACCALLLVVLLKLWRADLRVPFAYLGDGICTQLWAKGMAETGWFLDNPALGAPFGLEMHDFPLSDGLLFLVLRGLVLACGDPVVAVHAFYSATFFLATASALFALRKLGAARGPAVVSVLLYAFLHYHFFRGEAHLFLAAYFLVPLAVMVCVWLYRDGELLFRESEDGRARLDLGGRALGAIAICGLIGAGGIYYAAFTCCLLMVAGLGAAVARRRLHPLGSAALLVGLIAAVGVANLVPSVLYRLRHGPNPAAVMRVPIHVELWGLRMTQLLLPVQAHRIGALAGLRRRYDLAQNVQAWDGDATSIGLVGAVGFLALLAVVLIPRRDRSPRTVDGLAALNLAALLLATTSGLGAVIGYVVSPVIRCYNRVVVFTAFFALAAVALGLTRAVRAARPGWPRVAAYAGLAALLALGILDQTPRSLAPDYDRVKVEYARDAAFVGRIESAMPGGAMVFQLPILEFPETVAPGAMLPYDHGRAYLHSKTLRWSYGAMKGRFADAWQKAAADQPTPDLLRTLAVAGFSGVYVDRAGYDDRGAAIDRDLARETGARPIESDDHRLAFYNLRPFATALRDRLGAERWAAARAATLDAVTATWLGGFLGRDDGPDGSVGRVCASRGRLRLDNPSGRARRVEVSMDLRSAADAPRRVRIEWPDGAAEYPAGPAAVPVRRSLVVPPGGLTVLLSVQGIGPSVDPKSPAFRVERFALAEPGVPAPGRLAESAGAGSARR